VQGPFFLTAALAAKIVAKGSGSIVNVTTIAAQRGISSTAVYGSTKACTAPELVAAVLTWGLGGWLGWGKIPFCVCSSPVSDHDPGLRLVGAAGA
jgi:hypothetical protein